MDILIESTKDFEKDLERLSKDDIILIVEKINDCASLFTTNRAKVYRKMRRLRLPSFSNGYESSLYTLKVSEKLRAILAVDEDPIFGQVIFTLFRVMKHKDIDKAYQDVADLLYQDFLHEDQETAHIS